MGARGKYKHEPQGYPNHRRNLHSWFSLGVSRRVSRHKPPIRDSAHHGRLSTEWIPNIGPTSRAGAHGIWNGVGIIHPIAARAA